MPESDPGCFRKNAAYHRCSVSDFAKRWNENKVLPNENDMGKVLNQVAQLERICGVKLSCILAELQTYGVRRKGRRQPLHKFMQQVIDGIPEQIVEAEKNENK